MTDAGAFAITASFIVVPPLIALVLRVMSTRTGRPTRWANWALIVFGLEIACILYWVRCVDARCYPEWLDHDSLHGCLGIAGMTLTVIGLVVYFETPPSGWKR